MSDTGFAVTGKLLVAERPGDDAVMDEAVRLIERRCPDLVEEIDPSEVARYFPHWGRFGGRCSARLLAESTGGSSTPPSVTPRSPAGCGWFRAASPASTGTGRTPRWSRYVPPREPSRPERSSWPEVRGRPRWARPSDDNFRSLPSRARWSTCPCRTPIAVGGRSSSRCWVSTWCRGRTGGSSVEAPWRSRRDSIIVRLPTVSTSSSASAFAPRRECPRRRWRRSGWDRDR